MLGWNLNLNPLDAVTANDADSVLLCLLLVDGVLNWALEADQPFDL